MSYCYKTSDNKFFGCPPRMADGRHFTDYRPNCYVNNLVKAENGIQNSFQYRLFLSQNADQLMDINRGHACQKNCCSPCQEPFQQGTLLPEETKQVCDKHSCRFIPNDQNGLGLGRVYSNEKCDNLPEAWPVNQQANSCITPQDAHNFYPLDRNVYNTVQRLTVQGGAIPVKEGGDPRVHQ